jgi:hypothetical protein
MSRKKHFDVYNGAKRKGLDVVVYKFALGFYSSPEDIDQFFIDMKTYAISKSVNPKTADALLRRIPRELSLKTWGIFKHELGEYMEARTQVMGADGMLKLLHSIENK